MFGSFLPNLWSSCNQSVRSREPTLLCNQVAHSVWHRPGSREGASWVLFPGMWRSSACGKMVECTLISRREMSQRSTPESPNIHPRINSERLHLVDSSLLANPNSDSNPTEPHTRKPVYNRPILNGRLAENRGLDYNYPRSVRSLVVIICRRICRCC
jgi:hypothetical protein